MILFHPSYFTSMLYSMELMYNPVHNSKMFAITKKDLSKESHVDWIILMKLGAKVMSTS